MKTTPANCPILSTAASMASRFSASKSITTSYLPRVGNMRFTPSILPRNSTTSSNLPCAVLIKTHAESKQSTSILYTAKIVNKWHISKQIGFCELAVSTIFKSNENL